jgi:hypothetical protein
MADTDRMSGHLDERLRDRWVASRNHQDRVRAVLAKSSLPVQRFEGWALELISDALARAEAGRPVAPPRPPAPAGAA